MNNTKRKKNKKFKRIKSKKKIKKMINKNPIGILIRFVAKHKKSTFFFLYFYFYLKGKELGERLLLYPEGCEALKPWERKEKNK